MKFKIGDWIENNSDNIVKLFIILWILYVSIFALFIISL